jgi:hypothetical protein
MSARNGDKARFQRQRQAGLRRRERSRAVGVAMRLETTRLATSSGEAASDGGLEQTGGLRLIRGESVAR